MLLLRIQPPFPYPISPHYTAKKEELAGGNSVIQVYAYAVAAVLQLGFLGRGALGRALFAQSYKNEGTMCHVRYLVSRHFTKYNPIPQ